MNFDDFKKHLETNKEGKRVYLFVGKEQYVKDQAYALLIQKYTEPSIRDLNTDTFSAKETGVDKILSVAETFPMMGEFRLVFVKQAEHIKDADLSALKKYLADPAERSILVFDGDLDEKSKLCKLLAKYALMLECRPLKGQALIRWIQAYAKAQGLNAEYASLQRLVDYTGSDLYNVVNELEKLFLYASDKSDKTITQEMVYDLVVKSRSYSIFELTDALGKKQRKRALHVLNNLFNGGEEPLKIVTMLARLFRQMLVAKTLLKRRAPAAEIAQQTQVPGFLIDDFLKQVKIFSEEDIISGMKALSQADLAFKSTSTNEKFYLETMLCRVTNG